MESRTLKLPQACEACRRLKRRCTKEKPACSLCQRLGKTCKYIYFTTGDSEPPSSALSQRLRHLEQLVEAHASSQQISQAVPAPRSTIESPGGTVGPGPRSGFPRAFFLDTDYLRPLAPSGLVPSSFRSHLEQTASPHIGTDHDAICDAFLSSAHRWLPIVSRKLLRTDLRPTSRSDGCSLLLLLTMKLCASLSAQAPQQDSELYQLTARLCSEAEAAGAVSLRLVQSLVLLAVFEIAHAVYPAAYLTVGRAARMAMLAGMHDRARAQQLFKPADTWSSDEEHRRTWWAIFVLDRFVSIGTSGLPLVAPEPSSGDLLPVNDHDWDNGRIVPNEPLYTESFSHAAMIGAFAKTCQAAHILGKVLAHQEARKSPPSDARDLLSEARHLHHALASLQSTLESGEQRREGTSSSRLSALALCASARLLLYDRYGCNDPSAASAAGRIPQETEMQRVSLEGIKAIAGVTAPAVARAVVGRSYDDDDTMDGEDVEIEDEDEDGAVSPFVAQFLYHAATECAWFIREDHEPHMCEALRVILLALEAVSRRCGVGSEYIALLEQGDVMELVRERVPSLEGGVALKAPGDFTMVLTPP